jgi:hypothetical protein
MQVGCSRRHAGEPGWLVAPCCLPQCLASSLLRAASLLAAVWLSGWGLLLLAGGERKLPILPGLRSPLCAWEQSMQRGARLSQDPPWLFCCFSVALIPRTCFSIRPSSYACRPRQPSREAGTSGRIAKSDDLAKHTAAPSQQIARTQEGALSAHPPYRSSTQCCLTTVHSLPCPRNSPNMRNLALSEIRPFTNPVRFAPFPAIVHVQNPRRYPPTLHGQTMTASPPRAYTTE